MADNVSVKRNNNTLWIVLAAIAALVILGFVVFAANRDTRQTTAETMPSATASADSTADTGSLAALSAEEAADRARIAADSARDSARDAAADTRRVITTDPDPSVEAVIPGPGDSTITVRTPSDR